MGILIFLLMFIPIGIIAYVLSPGVYLYIKNSDYRKEKQMKSEKTLNELFDFIPVDCKYMEKAMLKLSEAGIEKTGDFILFLMLTFLCPFTLAVYLLINGYGAGMAVAAGLISISMPGMYISAKINERKKAFTVSAYKLYYFLHSQITSGIKATDAIKGLHEIIDHPLVKKSFVKFVAQYELTLDIEKSLEIIRKSFGGYDCEMLCTSISQCINTGMAGKTMIKMEEIMFSKYFNCLQKDTDSYKTKLLISGILAMVPLIALFIIPMVYEAFEGLKVVLSY